VRGLGRSWNCCCWQTLCIALLWHITREATQNCKDVTPSIRWHCLKWRQVQRRNLYVQVYLIDTSRAAMPGESYECRLQRHVYVACRYATTNGVDAMHGMLMLHICQCKPATIYAALIAGICRDLRDPYGVRSVAGSCASRNCTAA
jgi:hypothetical protein